MRHNKVAYQKLKASTRALNEAAGGLESAEEETRVSRSTLSVAQNPNAPQFLPVDALIDLTDATGNYRLLFDICAILGFQMPARAEGRQSGTVRDLDATLPWAHKEGAEAITCGLEAGADKTWTNEELRRQHKEAGEAEEAYRAMRVACEDEIAKRGIALR